MTDDAQDDGDNSQDHDIDVKQGNSFRQSNNNMTNRTSRRNTEEDDTRVPDSKLDLRKAQTLVHGHIILEAHMCFGVG